MTQATLSTLTVCPIMQDVFNTLSASGVFAELNEVERSFAVAALGVAFLKSSGVEMDIQTIRALNVFADTFVEAVARRYPDGVDTPEDLG